MLKNGLVTDGVGGGKDVVVVTGALSPRLTRFPLGGETMGVVGEVPAGRGPEALGEDGFFKELGDIVVLQSSTGGRGSQSGFSIGSIKIPYCPRLAQSKDGHATQLTRPTVTTSGTDPRPNMGTRTAVLITLYVVSYTVRLPTHFLLLLPFNLAD
jgi:hypothetical protein